MVLSHDTWCRGHSLEDRHRYIEYGYKSIGEGEHNLSTQESCTLISYSVWIYAKSNLEPRRAVLQN